MSSQTFSGIEVLGNLSWGTHFCQFYETKEDLLEILVPYFRTGLSSNEYCICVVAGDGPVSMAEIRDALAGAVPEFALRQSARDIEFFSESEWYFEKNQFNSAHALALMDEKCKQALAKGYTGVRGWGDTSWLREHHWENFEAYEKRLDGAVGGTQLIVLCTYPIKSTAAAEILDVANNHRFAIARRNGEWAMLETETHGEARARLIVDTIPTMAWTVGPDGVVDFLNKRWTEYVGPSTEANANPNSIVHPDDLQRVLEKWQVNMKAGAPSEDELRLRRFDGEYRWFLIRIAPLTDEFGRIVKWYGVSTDINESKQLSHALRESERRYLSLFENMKEGVAYLQMQFDRNRMKDAIYLEVNPAWEALTGYKNVVGRRQTELFPGAMEASSELIERATNVALSGKPDRFETYSKWLKKWFSVSAYCPRKEQVIIVLDDITERREAEEKLQLAYQRLSYHVENTPVAVIEFDKDLYVKRWSKRAEELFGWKASEALGRNVYDRDFPIVYREDVPAVDEINEELTKGTVDWNQSHNRNNTKDGDVVSCEWYNSVLKDEQGNVITILSLVLDVTERTKTQAKLQQVNAELHNLSGHLQNIREAERTAVAREIHDELGQQLTGLKIDAMWVAKKLEKGDKALRNKVTDMVALINETMKTVRRISTQLRPDILDDLGLIPALEWQTQEFEKRTGIRSHFTSSHFELELEIDLTTNIFRIYQEALTNITKHANASRVDTTLECKQNAVKLTVKDDGQGFNAALSPEGSFGLIGMKERALMMGGELTIETEKQKGTVITLVVPIQTGKKV